MSLQIAQEMITRYVTSLAHQEQWAVPCVVLALLWAFAPRVVPLRHARTLRTALTLAAVVFGLMQAWRLRWLCDDAFISFRYADNLVRGHGLVFNVGERVEGYTNFLWTLVLALFVRVGFDIGQVAIVFGMIAYATLILLTARMSERLSPEGLAQARYVPLAALLCGAQLTLGTFATSGLETMFGAALALAALERALAGGFLASGLFGVGAAMTHPDHGILYAALGLALLLHAPSRRGVVRYALPFVLVYLPYFAWRVHYYGDLFPNTYYAKSADISYYSQGAIYLSAFLVSSGLWAALPLVAIGAYRARRELLGPYVMLAAPLFCAYIAKIGGDFMHGRLLCPLLAPLLLAAELGARSMFVAGRTRAVGSALALSLVMVPASIFRPMEKKWHLADERSFYLLKSFSPIQVSSVYADWARDLLRVWKPHARSPRIGMRCVGLIGYYTGWPLIDGFGLTDRTVARRPLWQRGRPGHEKSWSPAYLVSRDVDIADEATTYPSPYVKLTRVRINKTSLHLVHYDPKVVGKLAKVRGATFTNFESHLRTQLRASPKPVEGETAACDAWFAETYYFSRVPNSPLRKKSFERLLAAGQPRHPSPGVSWPSLSGFEQTHVPLASTAIRFEGRDPIRFEVSGEPPVGKPVRGETVGQDMISGYSGSLINTFVLSRGDVAVGTLRSKPFVLVGDVMTLSIGGGRHAENLRVSLLIDGQRQFSSGGCTTEMMGRRIWQIAPFRGKHAVLEIVDNLRTAWGHLVLDDIVQWVPKTAGGS